MAHGKWQKKTMIELYMNREHEAWYFRAFAIASASLLLLGFLIFAQAFPSSSTSASALTIVAAIFLALGYSLSVALWLICRSWLFQLDVIFIPCLLSCLLGTINAGITIGVNSIPWSATSIAVISVGAASSISYLVFVLLIGRKIQQIRNHDQTLLRKPESRENLTLLPEEEMQRQNLLRLLVKNKEESQSSQQTYRIGIPDNSVVLRTPPPLTGPYQDLGLTGTLRHDANTYNPQNVSIGALPLEEQFAFQRGNIVEQPISSQLAALEAARDKARIAKARQERAAKLATPSLRGEDDTLPYPPVIVNGRRYEDDISDIPLSEQHPLERQGHIPARSSKDRPYENIEDTPGVYREESDYGGHDYDQQDDSESYDEHEPAFEIVEGADIQIDLSKDYTRTTRQPINPSYSPNQQSLTSQSVASAPRDEYRRSRGSRYS